MPENDLSESDLTNRDLVIPYLAPYVVYVVAGSLLQKIISFEWIYAFRIVVVTAILIWAWKWYIPITGPKSRLGSIAAGVFAGLIGCLGWVFLVTYFLEPYQGEPWTQTGFFLRLAAASFLVPVFEEILMRGYIFRVALQWDLARRGASSDPFGQAYEIDNIKDVEPGNWSFWAVVISTLIFTAGHHTGEWVASVFYGILMSVLWIIRKDLLSCIVAHGVTNCALAGYVKYTGKWGFW